MRDEPPEDREPGEDSGRSGDESPRDTKPLRPPSGEDGEPRRPPATVLREAADAGQGSMAPPLLDETDRVRLVPHEEEPTAWRIILQTLHPGTARLGLNVWQTLVIGRLDGVGEGEAPDLDMSPHRAAALGVSRQHAAFVPGADALFLVDLHSTNGTWVNGRYLPPGQRHPLRAGDRIELGLLRLVVRSVSPLKRAK